MNVSAMSRLEENRREDSGKRTIKLKSDKCKSATDSKIDRIHHRTICIKLHKMYIKKITIQLN